MALEAAYHQAKALGRVVASRLGGLAEADSSDSAAPQDASDQQLKDLLQDPEFLADQVGMLEDVIGDSVYLRDAAPQGEDHQYIASNIHFLQKQTEMLQKALGVSAQQIGQPVRSEDQSSDVLALTVAETMCDILGDNNSVLNTRPRPAEPLNMAKPEFVARLLSLLRRLLGSYIAQRQSSAKAREAAADRILALQKMIEKEGTELTTVKAELDRQKAAQEELREEVVTLVAKCTTLEVTTQSQKEEVQALKKARDEALRDLKANCLADDEGKQQLGAQLYAALQRLAEQEQQLLEQDQEIAGLRDTAVESDSQQAEPSPSDAGSALSARMARRSQRETEVIPVQRARLLVLAGHGTRLPPRLAKEQAQLEQVPVKLPEGEDSLCEFSPDTLRDVLGGSKNLFFVRISQAWSSNLASTMNIKHYMLVDISHHPWGPTGPGDHGYIIGNIPSEVKPESNGIRTHVFAGIKKTAFYYCGEYRVKHAGKLTEEEAAFATSKSKTRSQDATTYMSLQFVAFDYKFYKTLMSSHDDQRRSDSDPIARIAIIPHLDLRPAKRRRMSGTEDEPTESQPSDQTSKRARRLQDVDERSEVKDEDELSAPGTDEDPDPDASVQSDADDMEED